jgi:hypothetical protein
MQPSDNPNLSSSDPHWTDEELFTATQRQIRRGLKSGWKWEPPFLVKDQVKHRPTARMLTKTPANRDFNPATDAFAFRISPHVEFRGNGIYAFGNLLMRHDGTLIDPDVCLECLGARWFVAVKAPITVKTQRPWESHFTYCRSCVSQAEIDDWKRRQADHGAKQAAKRR